MCFKNVVRRSGAFLSALVLCFSLAMPVWATSGASGASYNLADFSGSICSSEYSNSYSGVGDSFFDAGGFPLYQSYSVSSANDSSTSNRGISFFLDPMETRSGDVLTFIFRFPDSSCSYTSDYSMRYVFWFGHSSSEAYRSFVTVDLDDLSVSFYKFLRPHIADPDSFLSYWLYDSTGAVVGVRFSFVLLYPLERLELSTYFDSSLTSAFSGNISLSYDSFLDFQILVQSSSSGDSSGSGTSGDSGSSSTTPAADPNLTILSTQVFETSGSVVGLVDGVDLSAGSYSVVSSVSCGGEELLTSSQDVTTIPCYIHHSFKGLTPETEYTNTYTLYKDGSPTSVTASTTYTTQAAADTGGDSGDSGSSDATDLSSVLTSLDAIRAEQKTQTSLLQQIKDFLTGKTDKNGEYSSELEDQTGVSKDSIKDKKTDIEAFNDQGYGITEDVQTGLAAVVPVFSAFSFVFSILAVFIGLGVLGIVIRKGLS